MKRLAAAFILVITTVVSGFGFGISHHGAGSGKGQNGPPYTCQNPDNGHPKCF